MIKSFKALLLVAFLGLSSTIALAQTLVPPLVYNTTTGGYQNVRPGQALLDQSTTGTSPGWYTQITGDAFPRVRVGLNITDVASIALGSGAAARDTFIERAGAANVRFGSPDAAAPIAQTLSVQNVVSGTSNTAGANLTVAGSQGTGTGCGGSILFKTAPAGSTGSAQNALATVLTLDCNKLATVAGGLTVTGATTTISGGVGLVVNSGSAPLISLSGSLAPEFKFTNTSGATDQKAVDSYVDTTGAIHNRMVNDLGSLANDYYAVTRSGYVPQAHTWTGTSFAWNVLATASTALMTLTNPSAASGAGAAWQGVTGTANSFTRLGVYDGGGSPIEQWIAGSAVVARFYDAPNHQFRSTGGSGQVVIGSSGLTVQVGYTQSPAFVSTGSPPTLSGTCTHGSQVGGNTSGKFTATCSSQTVIITFAAATTNGWDCTANDNTTPADTLRQTSFTTFSCTLTGTTAASDVITFHAIGF